MRQRCPRQPVSRQRFGSNRFLSACVGPRRRKGKRSYATEIHQVLTVELIDRLVLDNSDTRLYGAQMAKMRVLVSRARPRDETLISFALNRNFGQN
jgi:hypothetical protein